MRLKLLDCLAFAGLLVWVADVFGLAGTAN